MALVHQIPLGSQPTRNFPISSSPTLSKADATGAVPGRSLPTGDCCLLTAFANIERKEAVAPDCDVDYANDLSLDLVYVSAIDDVGPTLCR